MNDFQTKTWVEPLSQREIEILGLISDGLSNREIAQKIYLSDNTVKWYNKQIFTKLGVNSRTQAISLARQFSLLESLAPLPGKDEIRSQHNLPLQLTSFIGREKEIDHIKRLVSPSGPQENSGTFKGIRLVTLTGTGGVGKTRLATQVGYELLEHYPHGVWLVELAPLADPELVPKTLITVFGLSVDARRSALMVLADYLRKKKALLILDNCEHVIEACARVVENLLRQCPDLCVLASSREALGIEGEVALKVPSLSLPPANQPTLESMNQSEAVRLFLDRTATLPGFVLTEENAKAVARVCRQLDGIPLAIELAATRVRLLKVEQIDVRLDDAFRLLTGGSRTALPRQQTLRATIDWSYNLLSEAERSLFRRLGVFVGGGRLEAVEAICSGGGLEEYEVLDILTQLVNKSLVIAEIKQSEEPRYSLLETIRQYAREKLNESGECEAVRKRHVRWYAELAETADLKTHGHGQIEWLDRLEQEHDNLRAALEWCLNNNVESGLHIAIGLTWFWQLRSHYLEGYWQLSKLLATGPSVPSLLHARALTWASWLAAFAHYDERSIALATTSLAMSCELDYLEGQAFSNLSLANQLYLHGDFEEALPPAETGLALIEQAGNQWGIRQAFGMVGLITLSLGDYERAHALIQKSLRLSREIGDIDGISWSLYLLGNLALKRGDFKKAMAYYQESLPLAREVRNNPLISWIHAHMGDAAIQLGDIVQGKALMEESIVLMQELSDYPCMEGVLTRLGRLARLQGEYEQATKFYSEGLKLALRINGHDTAAWSIAGLAEINAMCGQPRKAARLLAAVQDIPKINEYIEPYRFSDWQGELGQITDTIRSLLDEPTFQVEQEFGRLMLLGDAAAYALEGITV